MKTRIYNHVYKIITSDELWWEKCNDVLLHRVNLCYRNSPLYTNWFFSTYSGNITLIRPGFLHWLENITPQELELEFNEHEILELMTYED